MSNLRNHVQLIGRLGKDPETKAFENGKQLVTISLATSESYRNTKGEKVEEVQWHNLVLWDKIGEVAAKYLHKGNEIAVSGKLVYRTYETKEGEKRYITEITVGELVMLGSKQAD